MSARFLATPPVPATGKRPNGKTVYRASASIILQRDDGTMRIVRTGWLSDGGSFPWWAKLIGPLYLALAGGAFVAGLPPALSVALALAGCLAGLWFVTLPSRLNYAYFMHDEACQQMLDFPDKREADRLFNEAMKALGVSVAHRWPIYAYVRMRSQRVQGQQPEFQWIEHDGRVVGWR